MQKLYSRINWENRPSIETPLNEQNLNRMDDALDSVDNRVIQQDTTKADKTELNDLVTDWVIDEETGIITITKKSGEKILFDLNIEKIPVSFSLSDDGILTMTTEDGTEFTANIGAMIPILTFNNSDTISVSVSGTGVNKVYSFSIKNGSVTEEKLQPNYLADIMVEAGKAETSATTAGEKSAESANSANLSKSYAVGGTGTRPGENTDNAKHYSEQAKDALESLQSGTVTGVKGNEETTYRTGNVNITSSDVGAISKSGDTMTGDLTAPRFYGDLEGTAKNAYALVEYDTRDNNKKPSWYQANYPMRTITELKLCHSIGLTSEPSTTGGYCTLVTSVPWSDNSGGYANQIAICNSGRKYTRVGQEGDSWSSWVRLITDRDTATASAAGLTKLYTSTGTSTDGTMTRDSITKELNKRASNTWRLISANGTTSLPLPNELFNSGEIIVQIQINTSPFYCYSWTVISGALNRNGITLIDGYKTGNYEGAAEVHIDQTKAQITRCIVGNYDQTDNCMLKVYYRS